MKIYRVWLPCELNFGIIQSSLNLKIVISKIKMLEIIIQILLTIATSVIGAIYDSKKNPASRLTIFLVVLIILSAILTGFVSWNKTSAAEAEKVAAVKKSDALEEELKNLKKVATSTGKDTSDIKQLVSKIAESFGIKRDSATPEKVANSLLANDAMNAIVSVNDPQLFKKITVQYFPKQIDRDAIQETLVASLKGAGYNLITGSGNPTLKDTQTNSIWYGSNVPEQVVKHLALSLSRAGINIQAIQPFSDKNSRSDMIQIGSSAAALQKQVISVDQIVAMQIAR